MTITGAELLVRNLEAQDVRYVFGVPGAKIDRVYDALLDSRIETVVCRHEQNASFIAQGLGRMTGKAGVCLVTSGPGTTNLVTGFATATSEGSPVVGFGGVVPRADRLKQAHQSLDTATLLRGVSKYSDRFRGRHRRGRGERLPGRGEPAPGCSLRRIAQ